MRLKPRLKQFRFGRKQEKATTHKEAVNQVEKKSRVPWLVFSTSFITEDSGVSHELRGHIHWIKNHLFWGEEAPGIEQKLSPSCTSELCKCPSIHPSIHEATYPATHPSIHPLLLRPVTHLFTHPSNHPTLHPYNKHILWRITRVLSPGGTS